MSTPLTAPANQHVRRAVRATRPEHVTHRVVGLGFAAAAVGDTVGRLPIAQDFLEWLRDTAWLPPYPWLLGRLAVVAPAVVGLTIVFEAVVARMLLARWHEEPALALVTLWAVGPIPAVGWPYWTVNVVLGLLLAVLWRRAHRASGTA